MAHKGDAGFVAERDNPFAPGTKVVVYKAAQQGIDVGPDRYAVVCDAHGSILGDSSAKAARSDMAHPAEFCEGCRARAAELARLERRILSGGGKE